MLDRRGHIEGSERHAVRGPLGRAAFAIAAAVLGSIALLAAWPVSLPASTVPFEARDGVPVLVRIGGNELAIPQRYFAHGSFTENRSFLIHALFPTMEPQRPDNAHEFNLRTYVTVLASDLNYYAKSTIEYQVEWRMRQWVPNEDRGERYGLRFYLPTHPQAALRGYQEMYVGATAGKPTEIMTCRIDGSAPNPQCELFFAHRNMLVKVRFNKDPHLPDWREIEQGVKTLINRFAEK